ARLAGDLVSVTGRSPVPFVDTSNVLFVVQPIDGDGGLESEGKRHRCSPKIRQWVSRRETPSVRVSAMGIEVHCGDDGQPPLQEAREAPLEIPYVPFFRVRVDAVEPASLALKALVVGEKIAASCFDRLVPPLLHGVVVEVP